MTKKAFLILTAAILCAAVLPAGCSTDSGAPGGRSEHELILAIGSEPADGFDPTTGWGRYGSPLFQSTLLTRDVNLNLAYDLATGYSISEDGLTWIVTIRDDVKFSDSIPLTAADVVYTFSTASASGSVIDLSIMDSVEAEDDYTVVFKLNEPRSSFVNLLVSTGIVPAHAHGADYALNPIGSGPFKLVQWDKGQQLIVEANPLYYGSEPFFKRLTFLFLSEDAAFAAAKSGGVDVAWIPPTFAKQEVPGMRLAALESVDNRGIMFPYVKDTGKKNEKGHPIGNNVTADLAIRKAVNYAIDRGALVEGVLEGYGTPAYTVCDRMPWWNPDTTIADGDLDKARQILADGGWSVDAAGGILKKSDLEARFTLVYPAADQTRQALALAAAEMIRPLGIDVQVEGKGWEGIEAMMHANAVLFGWGSYDPLEMYNLYGSKTAGAGWYNTGYYSNPAVDDYMERALASASEEEAIEYWQKAQWDGVTGFSALGDAPWAWLVNLGHLYLVRDNLDIGNQKIQPHGHGWPITDNIVEWKWK